VRSKRPELAALLEEDLIVHTREASCGRECHLVGGILRDRILGIGSPDLDLVVAGQSLAFSKVLAVHLDARLVMLGGTRFSAFRIVGGDFIVDVWDRADAGLESDLERRDFTINAMALDLSSGLLLDPFEGLTDLESRRLRAVTPRSFAEDPLRVLRLVRFATQLPSFSIDGSTLDLARAGSRELPAVAVERRREELTRILAFGPPTASIGLLLRLGALEALLTPNAALESYGTRLMGALRAFESFEQHSEAIFERRPERIVCLHALLALMLPRSASPGLSVEGGLVTRRQARAISRLTTAGARDLEQPRIFLARWGELWLEAAAVASSLDPDQDAGRLRGWMGSAKRLLESEGSEVLDPTPLLDGHELTKVLEIPEGPLVGRLLGLLRAAQIRGEITTRDQAIAILPELLADEIRQADR
jgi:tRNA nucleotidyltransferase/poly(A) polymerase